MRRQLRNLKITVSQKYSANVNTQKFETFYDLATKNATDWEAEVDTRYNEDVMLAYLTNRERGFGRFNDEALFQSERLADASGMLYEEALKGFWLSEECVQLMKRYGQW